MPHPDIVTIGQVQTTDLVTMAANAVLAERRLHDELVAGIDGEPIVVLPPRYRNLEDIDWFDGLPVLADQLLVWERDITEALGALGGAATADLENVTPHVRILRLDPAFRNQEETQEEALVRALELVRAQRIRVSFNHVVASNTGQSALAPILGHTTAKGGPTDRQLRYALPPRPRRPLIIRYFVSFFRWLPWLERLTWLEQVIPRLRPVTVAVLDTGVYGPLTNPNAPRRVDGWLNDVTGDDDLDGSGHGTAVAGVVQLVAPEARVVSYRVLQKDLGGEVKVAKAIIGAAAAGAKIINLSLGCQPMLEHSPLSIEDALLSIPDDVIVVAAAGNSHNFNLTMPGCHKRALAVGASDEMNPPKNIADYSTRGYFVDFSTVGSVAAPCIPYYDSRGTRIITTVVSGTSLATPAISGRLAVSLAKGMSADAAITALRAEGRFEPDLGWVVDILDQQ